MSVLLHSGGQELLNSLGGPGYMMDMKRRVEALALPSCPFCGGTAEVCVGMMCLTPRVMIRCGSCKSATCPQPAGYDVLHKRNTTVNEALTAAVSRWNRRQ